MSGMGAGELCRLTVVAPSGRADLAVPAHTPLLGLLPTLIRHADPDLDHARTQGGHWALQRLGEPPLDVDGTPASLGLRDGELLYLRPGTAPLEPLDFDDVIDGVSTAIRGRPDQWSAAASRRLFLGLGGLAALAALVGLLAFAGPNPLRTITAGAFAVVAAAGAAAFSRALGDAAAGMMLGASAVGFAAASGLLLPGGPSLFGGANLLAGGAFATAATALVLAATAVSPLFVGTLLVSFGTAVGGLLVVWLKVSGGAAAAAVAAVFFLFSALAPTTAASMVRIRPPQLPTGAHDLNRDIDPVPEQVVLERAALADRYLSAILVAVGVLCAGCFVVLVTEKGWAAKAFVAVVAVAMMLRSRSLVSSWQKLAAMLPGGLGLVLAALALAAGAEPPVRMALLSALVVGTGLLAVGARRIPGRQLLPYWGRAADILETVFAIAVVPLALAVLDVFALVRSLTG